MGGQYLPKKYSISVTNGIGTLTTDGTDGQQYLSGNGVFIAVVAPSSAATFEIAITDVDGFPIAGLPNCMGNTKIEEDVQYYGSHTIKIIGTDGTYQIKVYFKEWL